MNTQIQLRPCFDARFVDYSCPTVRFHESNPPYAAFFLIYYSGKIHEVNFVATDINETKLSCDGKEVFGNTEILLALAERLGEDYFCFRFKKTIQPFRDQTIFENINDFKQRTDCLDYYIIEKGLRKELPNDSRIQKYFQNLWQNSHYKTVEQIIEDCITEKVSVQHLLNNVLVKCSVDGCIEELDIISRALRIDSRIIVKHVDNDNTKCRLAVIVGKNGSGKTDLFRCLHEASQYSHTVVNFKSNIQFTNSNFKKVTPLRLLNSFDLPTRSKEKEKEKILTIEAYLNSLGDDELEKIREKFFDWTGNNFSIAQVQKSGLNRMHLSRLYKDFPIYKPIPLIIVTEQKEDLRVTKDDISFKLLRNVPESWEDILWFLGFLYNKNCPTVFLDEPDKSFHHELVYKMLDEISSLDNKKTVILISHSTEIISWCAPCNLLRAVPIDGVTQFRALATDFDNDQSGINELFLTDNALLVEGKNDYKLLKSLRKHITESLNDPRYSKLKPLTRLHIIPVNGKETVVNFVTQARKFNCSVKVILDRDACFSKNFIRQRNGNLNLFMFRFFSCCSWKVIEREM